jgi:muramoyltetrapeptide carboxypeptidase
MNHPPFLAPGDRVAMVSPAGNISCDLVEKAKKLLEMEGFVVEVGDHTFDSFHLFAGQDHERAADMQKVLDDPGIKALFFTRGGYGSIRTLMLLDWSGFFLHPKWLIGFSDITVFHSYLNTRGFSSVHGVMTSFYFENEVKSNSFDRLLELLRGDLLEYELSPNPLNRLGTCTGELVGGNLSILQSLRGTSADLALDGKVLFIEDIDENDYNIDRMLRNLKFGGGLEKLSGLIAGYFTNTKVGKTPFGLTADEIVREVVAEYNFPVVFGFPAGHELPNLPLLLGGSVEMVVEGQRVKIKQSY